MNRPQVQIESENKIATLRRHLEKMLPEFEALPGVVGLTLNGGISGLRAIVGFIVGMFYKVTIYSIRL